MHGHLRSEGSVLIGSKSVDESGSEELSNEADDCSCWEPAEDAGLAVVSDVEVLEISTTQREKRYNFSYFIIIM